MTGWEAVPPEGFCDFFRDYYRKLVRDVIFATGHKDEAEDAVSTAMIEVLHRWDTIDNPLAYARRTAIYHAIKARQRGPSRIKVRIITRGGARPEGDLDPGLLVWEQTEWVMRLLQSLPPAEREVLAYVVDEFRPQEIAALLGKTETAVRRSLCTARKKLTEYLDGTGHDDTWEEGR